MHMLTTPYPILLNADVGEGFSYDEPIIDIVDIANIACGAHAGNDKTMRETLAIVRHYSKYAFAHVGYDDREHFGRKSINLDSVEFADSIKRQLDSFLSIAAQQNISVYGIKLHGALYHDISENRDLGEQLIQLSLDYCAEFHEQKTIVVAQSHSVFLKICEDAGVTTLAEAFIDRRYNADKKLVSRDVENSTINDAAQASEQAFTLSYNQSALSLEGNSISIKADTLCLHGDSESALSIAKAVATRLHSNSNGK